jgi:hypothetical protein
MLWCGLTFVEYMRVIDCFSVRLGFVVAGMDSYTLFFRRLHSDLVDQVRYVWSGSGIMW